MKKYIFFITLLITALIIVPIFGDAVFFENPIPKIETITDLVSAIIDFLLDLAFWVSSILVVYAGFLYMTSAGNQQKVQTAQKALIWTLAGYGVVLIARYVPGIIKDVLGL
ncbi:MAG: hypothetical protein WC909_03965 [Candidatus Paceibacterota bacterium]|jgi:membrane protease YdiL (CAAX protease family)